MVNTELVNRVRNIVANDIGLNVENVRNDSRIIEDLGADSLDFVEMVMSLEEAFECDIDDAVAEGFCTVQDIVDYLESNEIA